jgi:hypothetical protein
MMLDVQAICRTKLVKLNETDKQNSQKLSPLRLKPLHKTSASRPDDTPANVEREA